MCLLEFKKEVSKSKRTFVSSNVHTYYEGIKVQNDYIVRHIFSDCLTFSDSLPLSL